MRIAFILHQFPTVSETFILSQITGLMDRGHQIDIFASYPSVSVKVHPDFTRYRLQDRTHYRPRMVRSRFLRVLKGLGLVLAHGWKAPLLLIRSVNILEYGKLAISLELLFALIPFLEKNASYDVIHCHFGPNALQALALRKLGAIRGKLVTSFHGYDFSNYPRKHGTNVYEELFKKTDQVTANTAFTRDKVVRLGCPPEKILLLPVGLDMNRYRFQPRYASEDGTVRILTVARFVEKKGIEFSIQAISKLVCNYPDIQYFIVGDGPLRGSLLSLIKRLDVERWVQLLGWKTGDEVREIYSQSHIFVLSSVTAKDGDQEGQALVLQEAQAIGLPVVSTLHNGIPEGVLDGRSGFLVPEKDVDALAGKLGYLIGHPEVWSDMGLAGRAHVEQHYDINKLNDRLEEIYRKLCS